MKRDDRYVHLRDVEDCPHPLAGICYDGTQRIAMCRACGLMTTFRLPAHEESRMLEYAKALQAQLQKVNQEEEKEKP